MIQDFKGPGVDLLKEKLADDLDEGDAAIELVVEFKAEFAARRKRDLDITLLIDTLAAASRALAKRFAGD